MSAFAKYVLMFIGALIGSFVVGGIIGSVIETGGSIEIDSMLSGAYSLTFSGILFLSFVLLVLSKLGNGKSFFKNKKKKEEPKQFFDSKWLTENEMNKKYPHATFRHLSAIKSGIPIRAQLTGSDIHINLIQQDWHTMVVGSTSSGKTAGYISPSIQILSSTKDKPCLVLNDMKGELYHYHSEKLKASGYRIISLDLREPFKSTRWNPMEKPYNNYQRSLNLEKEVKVHTGGNPADLKLEILAPTYNHEWYEFEGRAYPSKEMLKNDLIALRKQLYDLAFEDLRDIAITICPIVAQGDGSTWERGAQDFILGTMLAMLEDSAFPELEMTKDKFNFFNLYKICTLREDDADNQFASLSKYFAGRPKLSTATQLAGPIINNAPVTTRGFMGVVSSKLSCFADEGVCFATSGNEMDFSHFHEQPTALFIKVPDEKDSRHSIAVMCIIQLYKTLVETANNTNMVLPRKVCFLLDEFGNLPSIPNLGSMITVARSRKILFTLVVQSYPQINIKYGDAVADTIRSNCNVHVFVGTTDQKTKEEFSARCGTVSVESTSTTKSKGKEGGGSSTTTNKTSVPLITVDELGLLKEGEFIISAFKESAIRSTFTMAHKAKNVYSMNPPQYAYTPARYLDTEKVYYDIRLRNKKVFRNRYDD